MPRGVVTVDHERCKRCGICVAVCPVDALEFADGCLRALAHCIGCTQCALHCPDFALSVERIKDAPATGEGAETP